MKFMKTAFLFTQLTSSFCWIVLLCMVTSCTEEIKPPVLVDIPQHAMDLAKYEAHSRKQIQEIKVDLGLKNIAPVRGLDQLSYITLPIVNSIGFGQSIFHDDADLEQFESRIQQILTETKLGLLAGSCLNDKELTFYVYTSDKSAWRREIEKIQAEFPQSGLTEITKEDRGWQGYYNFLMPSENQSWVIHNDRKKRDLINQGVSLDQAQKIRHVFYFRTTYNRDRTYHDLMNKGYQLISNTKETGNKKHPFYLEVRQTTHLDTEEFDQEILYLWELSKRRYSLYQGWEVEMGSTQ
ncbi:MAG: DUF695 domain-containing protein [Crocinitomicaceae bacterium]|nr:DUF695 domain-containing protein [Crocinitomicaceae bacterium]